MKSDTYGASASADPATQASPGAATASPPSGECPLRKVAINGCHGGFGLSDAAFIEFMRRKGVAIYAEPGVLGSSYWKTPLDEQPAILRETWYKVADNLRDKWHDEAEKAGQVYQHDSFTDRSDPDLIAVIEEFGDKAAARFSAPHIVEIPADVDWCIEEYDGSEWIAEKHRTWS